MTSTTSSPTPGATRDQPFVLAVVGARVVPVEGDPVPDGVVLVRDGRIEAIGPRGEVEVPADAEVVDAEGGWVLPGLIDAHVHLGVWEEGEGWAGQDTNEMTDPVMAAARAIDGINPREVGFDDALMGGITTVNVTPGSGNPIGGQAVALKTYGRVVDEMVLRNPTGIKSALGENPKRVYGEQKKTPSTRLGVALVLRRAFAAARSYQARVAAAEGKPVDTDLVAEVLGKVLDREIPWRQHCHRADDIATALRLADEFGYLLVLDHGTESYLLADLLAEKQVPVLYGPLIVSRSKVEVRDRSLRAPGILDRAGVEVSIITDHPVVPIEYLITQASLAVREGMDRDAALRAVTINPARVLGVDDRVGSLVVGKDADVVLWSGDPLELRSRVLRTWIGGVEVYTWDEATSTGSVRPR